MSVSSLDYESVDEKKSILNYVPKTESDEKRIVLFSVITCTISIFNT